MLTPEQEKTARELVKKLEENPASVSMKELEDFCSSIPLPSPKTGKPMRLSSYLTALGLDWHPTKTSLKWVLASVLRKQEKLKKENTKEN